jgi:hypothetical protein
MRVLAVAGRMIAASSGFTGSPVQDECELKL